MNEEIVTTRLKIDRGHLNITEVYAPKDERKGDVAKFHEDLEKH